MNRLEGKVALVTAGASGIGKAAATKFAAEGARVMIADIDSAAAEATAAEIGATARCLRCDVADSIQVLAAVEGAVDAFGGLDIMFNNAGIEGPGSIVDLDPAVWHRTLTVNLDGPFYGIKHAAPVIAAGGGGSIVNTASIAGLRALPLNSAYCTSKAGLIALTRCAALELRETNIRVNAILPSLIMTPAVERTRASLEDATGLDLDEYARERQGRWGTPEEVASAAVHLASEEASFTSGHCYVIDNAYTAA